MVASTSSPQVSDLDKWEFNQDKSRRELANMVALHDFPFSIVEYAGFQKFVKSLNPLFKLVCRTTVRDDCLESFREERSALRQIISTSGCRVSLTADMWTSVQRLGYLCVTCHYIDNNWKLQKRIIRFALMESLHDGLQMYNLMLKTIQYWHIEDKLCIITLDNASVNGSMMDDLRNNLSKRNLLIGGGALFHIRCAAHVLNLIVQDGLRVMGGIIDSIRESVKYIRSSQAREELFDSVVEKLGIECTKKPSLDVASRWNSTYLMIESVFPYQEAFVELGKQDKQFKFAPSEKEWALAEELRKLLRTFFAATKVVSGTKYPTSNRYFHEIWNVKLLLDRQAKNKNVIIASMVHEMHENFDKYWKESYLLNCIPLILDPRYKRGFVKFRLEQAFGKKDSEHHIAKVDEVMHTIFKEYSLQIGESAADNSEEEDDADAVLGDENPLADWEAHLKVQKKQVASELDRYLNEDLFPKRKVFDILGWWKINAPKFPILSCIARDLLAVQASTVASESAFSIGGRVVSDYRSRLKSGTVEGLICLQDWLRAAGEFSTTLGHQIIVIFALVKCFWWKYNAALF
jgi:hypothetical protein